MAASATLNRLLNVLILQFLLILEGSKCLHVTRVEVPKEVLHGADVTLQCIYDLEGDRLYSLKWYKGQHEFFRYMPNEVPKFRTFPWATFNIDYDPREIGKVFLAAVSREAEGQYKCEVSTEAPKFDTDYREENLTVFEIRSDGPVMTVPLGVLQNSLALGEKLRFTCALPGTRPPANLSWFVSGKQIASSESRLKEADDGLWTSESDLELRVTQQHLAKGPLVVNCVATLGSLYRKIASVPSRFSQETATGSVATAAQRKKDSSPMLAASSKGSGGSKNRLTWGLHFFLVTLTALLS